MEAYCVKCKSKRSMKDEKKVTMKNGKPATQGICTVCGTKMFKIVRISSNDVRIWLPVNEHPGICENEAFTLLGSNGAGKTTIFHILATLFKPISGIAFVNGFHIIKE